MDKQKQQVLNNIDKMFDSEGEEGEGEELDDDIDSEMVCKKTFAELKNQS